MEENQNIDYKRIWKDEYSLKMLERYWVTH